MEELKVILEDLFRTRIEEISFTRCYSGHVNSCYVAIYGNNKVFIKIQERDNLPIFYENQIEREIVATKLCQENKIDCPSIIAHGVNFHFVVKSYLDLPLLSEVWDGLDHDDRFFIKQQVLGLLSNLHSIKSPEFGTICQRGQLPKQGSWSECFPNLIRVAVEDCLHFRSLTTVEGDFIMLATLQGASNLLESNIPCLNHLDLHWNNLFVKKVSNRYKLVGVFDFGSALFTPEYMDFFRLGGGFLYGTDDFYMDLEKPYQINVHQTFTADLLNTIDYFVFLSFTRREYTMVKKHLMSICENYFKI